MKTNLAHKLDVIERTVQGWIQFDSAQRAVDGLATTDATAIMSPPTWPTHGMLKAWIKTLQEAREDALR